VLRPEQPELLPDDADSRDPSLSGWTIQDLSPADDYLGALAIQGEVREIRLFDDPGSSV
jgi:hypothetical protein